jgi:hypothetical protein
MKPRRIISRSQDLVPVGLTAYPIPEMGDLRLCEVISRFYDDLGDSSGDYLYWIPIDDPRKIDLVYEQARSEPQRLSDEKAIAKWDDEILRRGGKDHHVLRVVRKMIKELQIRPNERPLIVFQGKRDLQPKPKLMIPVQLLRTREGQNALGSVLVGMLTEQSVLDVQDCGRITPASLESFQVYIDTNESRLFEMVALERADQVLYPTFGKRTRYALFESDSVTSLTKRDYEQILAARRRYHLLLDERQRLVFCTRGRKSIEVRLEPRSFGIIADVMTAEGPVMVRGTRTGRQCASANAALHHFYKARKSIMNGLARNIILFARCTGCQHRDLRFEFVPPKGFKWAVIRLQK